VSDFKQVMTQIYSGFILKNTGLGVKAIVKSEFPAMVQKALDYND